MMGRVAFLLPTLAQITAKFTAMPGKGKPFEKGTKAGIQNGGAREGAGRPADWLREKCRSLCEEKGGVLDFLAVVARGAEIEQVVNAAGETLPLPASVKDRIKASELLLNRGYGMPNQPLSGPDGESLSAIPTAALAELVTALRQRVAGGAGSRTRKAEGK